MVERRAPAGRGDGVQRPAALGVLDVLRRSGLAVPGDVSVIGYDDSSLAGFSHVDLTTVAQDATALTTLAVARAIDRIEAAPVRQRDVVFTPRLVVRGTTGPLGG
ncbi:substrate-binding domain-containing protein [Amycolatopsis ruanii]|uniref:substrate-binding domain-containing protein n=1 Tax=Amycolatopsis ruanii TaxID=944491 RepID=UPI0023DE072D|nr:substrate-binding domain-containing protein [Amycolatopsis ruanii]